MNETKKQTPRELMLQLKQHGDNIDVWVTEVVRTTLARVGIDLKISSDKTKFQVPRLFRGHYFLATWVINRSAMQPINRENVARLVGAVTTQFACGPFIPMPLSWHLDGILRDPVRREANTNEPTAKLEANADGKSEANLSEVVIMDDYDDERLLKDLFVMMDVCGQEGAIETATTPIDDPRWAKMRESVSTAVKRRATDGYRRLAYVLRHMP